MYGPTAATRPRVLGAGWGEGGPLVLFSCKASLQWLFIYIKKIISEAEKKHSQRLFLHFSKIITIIYIFILYSSY